MTDTTLNPDLLRRLTTENHHIISNETARTAVHALRALTNITRILQPQTDADEALLRRIRLALDDLGVAK